MFEPKRRNWMGLCALLVVLGLLLAACGPTPEPQVVERIVTQVVEKTVKETVIVEGTPNVVEKIVTEVVEKVVTPTPEPTLAPKSEEPVFGGVLNIATHGVPATLDDMSTVGLYTFELTNQVMELLVAFGEDYSIVPMLAESWDISDDGKTYTLHLRQGIKFHNGKEMTSEDVIASIDRYLEVTPRIDSFEILQSYEATDDYTVVMHVTRPSASFLGILAEPSAALSIYPSEVITGKAKGEITAEDLIGTGPYQFVEYVPDQYSHLKRFEDYTPYPGEMDGLGGAKIAYFDDIYVWIVPEQAAHLPGLQTGEYDVAGGLAPNIPIVEADPNLKLVWNNHGEGVYILFNAAAPFSRDVKFRQAILAALDMEDIAQAAYAGRSEFYTLNECIWPTYSHFYFDDPVAKSLFNQDDPEMAKALLEEAGYAGEEIVILGYRAWEPAYKTSLAIADQLETKLGMATRVEVYDWPGYLAKMSEKDTYQMVIMGWDSGQLIIPEWFNASWTCNAEPPWNPYYCNPEMDAAFEVLNAAATNDQRQDALKEIQKVFYEDLPNIKLWDSHYLYFARSDIMGFRSWFQARYWGLWRQQ